MAQETIDQASMDWREDIDFTKGVFMISGKALVIGWQVKIIPLVRGIAI